MKYDAILFDFDGVLADTEPLHYQAWKAALEPAGVRLTWEVYVSSCIGLADQEMVEMLGRNADPPKAISELWPLYPLKKRMFQSLTKTGGVLHRETLESIKSLKDIALGVVTSSARSEIEPILAADGLLALLSTAVYGDEVSRLKPDPEPYRTACERVGAQRALVFEDSAAGQASARAAGCEVAVVRRVEEVPGLIERYLRPVSGFR